MDRGEFDNEINKIVEKFKVKGEDYYTLSRRDFIFQEFKNLTSVQFSIIVDLELQSKLILPIVTDFRRALKKIESEKLKRPPIITEPPQTPTNGLKIEENQKKQVFISQGSGCSDCHGSGAVQATDGKLYTYTFRCSCQKGRLRPEAWPTWGIPYSDWYVKITW